MERISKYQLSVMIMLFEIGSTPLFALGGKAKQDSWIAMLIAAAVGLLLLFMFLFIQRKAPDYDLIGLLRYCFGNAVGSFLGGCFVIYFSYESMRNVRDFGEITSVTLLAQTPQFIVMLVVVLLAAYAIAMGIEAFCRVVEVLMPVVLFSYTALIILITSSKLLSFARMEPVLENGIIPVLKTVFPDLTSFPFGQTVVFFMMWHLLYDKKKMTQISVIAYICVSLFLALMNLLNVMVLGPTLIANSTLPFLQTVQLIQVGDILERLDVFVTLLLFLGLFVKMTAFYWAATYALSKLLGSKSKYLIFCVGAIIFIASFLEPNYTYHIWLGLEVSLKLYPIFQVLFPLMMFIAMLIRKPPPQAPRDEESLPFESTF